jgi:hypothetical protein
MALHLAMGSPCGCRPREMLFPEEEEKVDISDILAVQPIPQRPPIPRLWRTA